MATSLRTVFQLRVSLLWDKPLDKLTEGGTCVTCEAIEKW